MYGPNDKADHTRIIRSPLFFHSDMCCFLFFVASSPSALAANARPRVRPQISHVGLVDGLNGISVRGCVVANWHCLADVDVAIGYWQRCWVRLRKCPFRPTSLTNLNFERLLGIMDCRMRLLPTIKCH